MNPRRVSERLSMERGSKKLKKGGNSASQPIRSEYGEILAGEGIEKIYTINLANYADDEGAHAVRESLIYGMGIPGCLPAQVEWTQVGPNLKVHFRMPRAPCTLRDILMNRHPYQGRFWKKMSVDNRLSLADKVCRDLLLPLGHLSRKGILHQDLHDANVVFWEGRFCPIDFGFAMVHCPKTLRRSDFNQWCPPPERVGGPSPVPLSIDTWSLGTLFTMCLAGNMPTYGVGGLAPQPMGPRLLYLSPGSLEEQRQTFVRAQTDWQSWHRTLFSAVGTRPAPYQLASRFYPALGAAGKAPAPPLELSHRLEQVMLGVNAPLPPHVTLELIEETRRLFSPGPPPGPPPGPSVSGAAATASRPPATPGTRAERFRQASRKRKRATVCASAPPAFSRDTRPRAHSEQNHA